MSGNIVFFPSLSSSPAQDLVQRLFDAGLLEGGDVGPNARGSAPVLKCRIGDALAELSPMLRFVIEERFPIDQDEAGHNTPASPEQVAKRLNLCPDLRFETDLLRRFNTGILTAMDASTLEELALRALRRKPRTDTPSCPQDPTADGQAAPRVLVAA